MNPIHNRDEFARAIQEPQALVFLWVNWATQARASRLVVDKVVESWNAEHPDRRLPCYLVDVSEQSGDLWDGLVEWLTAEHRPVGQLMMSGVGPLLWVCSGHVVLHMLAPLFSATPSWRLRVGVCLN